jgi:hypothetical protein
LKIIKEGNFEHVFPIEIKCEKVVDKYGFSYGEEKDFCGSELEITAEDIKKHEWSKYPDYKGADYGVVCPVCGRFIAIDTDKIPKNVLDNAPSIRLNT